MALKLGISATGNEPRADSDAVVGASQTAPTKRLQNVLDSDDAYQQDDMVIENEFGLEGDEFQPPRK